MAIGSRITLDGEKEFKKALAEINAGLRVTASELALVTAKYSDNATSVKALTEKNEVLERRIYSQKEKIEEIRKALTASAKDYGEADTRTMKWQVSLNKAEAELIEMQKALQDNSQELETAKQNMEKYGLAVDEVAESQQTFGEKLSGIISGLGINLPAGADKAIKALDGTKASTLALVGVVTGLVTGFSKLTIETAQYADELLTLSSTTGMSTDTLQELKYASELVDVSLETMSGSMSRMIRSMNQARDGGNEAAEAFQKLRLRVTENGNQLKDSEKMFYEVIDALGKISNETERDALAMQIFGKSAQELNPLIAQGSAGIAELTEEAKRMGAVMSEDSLNALGKFDDSIQRLKAGGEAAKNMLGTVLLPQLQILADDGVALIGEFTRGLSEANGDWTKISEVIGNTVGSLVSMLMENLPKLIQVGLDIVTSIGGAIVDNLPVIIDAAVQIVMTLLQALIDALPQITEGALQLVMALVQGIIDNLPALVEAAVQMIVTLAIGIGEALPELIPAIVEAIILICETLINNMDQILEAAFAIIEGLAQGLLNALPKLIEALPRIIASIIDFVTNNLPKIIELGITLIVQLAIGLVKAIPELVKSLPRIIAAIIEGLDKAVVSVVEIGKNIVKGIWEGIKSLGSWIKDKVSGFFSGIVDGVKNFLGIHSPSTVFEGIGGNMALGIGEGFDKAMARVADDMQNAVPTDFNISPGNTSADATGLLSPSRIAIEVPVYLDTKEIARVITPAISEILSRRSLQNLRAQGVQI